MAASPTHIIHHGRYSLLRRLGSGHFGEVWQGRDNIQDDEVAVKLLGRNVSLDAALLEVQLLTRLRRHERVVTIRNVELAPPVGFIVMDYLPAGSTGDRLASGNVTIVEAVRWTRDALGGLAHAHEMGVLHRDIKPDNLMLDDAERAVLSDFGIAEDTIRDLLAVSAVYARHAAPEVYTVGTSRASDIFAMGATLYRLLTGKYPFADYSAAAAGALTDPHRLNPQIPMALTRVVRRALAPDPADRYADARAMLTALNNCDVRYSWSRNDEPGDLETWAADGPDGRYELRLAQRSKGDFLVAMTRDKGKGPRHVFKETYGRRAEAVRVRRNLLTGLVERDG